MSLKSCDIADLNRAMYNVVNRATPARVIGQDILTENRELDLSGALKDSISTVEDYYTLLDEILALIDNNLLLSPAIKRRDQEKVANVLDRLRKAVDR